MCQKCKALQVKRAIEKERERRHTLCLKKMNLLLKSDQILGSAYYRLLEILKSPDEENLNLVETTLDNWVSPEKTYSLDIIMKSVNLAYVSGKGQVPYNELEATILKELNYENQLSRSLQK